MDTRAVADDSSSHQEAIQFFTEVFETTYEIDSLVHVKYIQGHLGQANRNIQTLIRDSYKNRLLSFFLDHPEAFTVYGMDVCLVKMTPTPTRRSPVPKRTPMSTFIEINFAEEATIGFLASVIQYGGPIDLRQLVGHCSQMSSEMRNFLNSQTGTISVNRLEDVLSSRSHIFDISASRLVSVVSKQLYLKQAEEKGLESMCRYLIGPEHLRLDLLFNKLQQQCKHLLHVVLNRVSQDGLEQFLLSCRDRFFLPQLHVWNITAVDRRPLEMERQIVKFFKQEIIRRAEGIHYVDLQKGFEKSNLIGKRFFNDPIQLAKLLWCYESDLTFNRGEVLTVHLEPIDIWRDCPSADRRDASRKAFRLYGSYLGDCKGVIVFICPHMILIQATVEDGGGVRETFTVFCHCKFCGVGNGLDPTAHLCQLLRIEEEVIFSAIYDESGYSKNPNKLPWSAVRVTKALPERPDPPFPPSPVKNPAPGPVKKQDQTVSRSNIEKTSLEHVADDTSHALPAFVSTGIVTFVDKNIGILEIDRPSGTKSVYFELSEVETDVPSGLWKIEVGQIIHVEFKNEQALLEATRLRLILKLQETLQNEAAPGGARSPIAAVKPSDASQVQARPVTPISVEVAATTTHSPSIHSAADNVMVSSRTSSRGSLAVSSNPDIDLITF